MEEEAVQLSSERSGPMCKFDVSWQLVCAATETAALLIFSLVSGAS